MPKMPQARTPGEPLPPDLLAAVEASDTPERKAAARKHLDAESAARRTGAQPPFVHEEKA